MSFRPKKPSNRKTIWLQIRKMCEVFPSFQYIYDRKSVIWVGILAPKEQIYEIRIKYILPYSPVVHVLDPKIREDSPHLYHDQNNALCLHYPSDRDWTPSKYISDTIVPWTAEWLWYYENWCITGKWFGREAPHRVK